MDGKWNNLFWQERGTGADSGAAIASIEQPPLENNTTKHLFKTFQDSPDIARQRLVRALLDSTAITVDNDLSVSSFHREITLEDDLIADATHTALVGISRSGLLPDRKVLADVTQSGGRPDGVIIAQLGEETLCLVLEVKTGTDDLTATELGKYCNALGNAPEAVGVVPWSTLQMISADLASATEDSIGSYLQREFSEYLSLQDLDAIVSGYSDEGRRKSVTVVEPQGDPRIRFRAVEGTGKSDSQEFDEEQFADLFGDIPDAVREDFFVELNYDAILGWAGTEAASGIQVASTSLGADEDEFYELVLKPHDDEPLFRIRRNTISGYPADQVYHFMFGPGEFKQLFAADSIGPGFTPSQRRSIFVDLSLTGGQSQ